MIDDSNIFNSGAPAVADSAHVKRYPQWMDIITTIEDMRRDFCGALPEHEQRWEDEGGAL